MYAAKSTSLKEWLVNGLLVMQKRGRERWARREGQVARDLICGSRVVKLAKLAWNQAEINTYLHNHGSSHGM